MHGRILSKLTYANVMATLAFFIAIGGGAYAAFHLPADSVTSKNIVNGKVKARDIAPNSLRSAGLPIDNNETCTGVGDGWASDNSYGQTVGFYRDPLGWVHLAGLIEKCGNPTNQFFTLPSGYRPGPQNTRLPMLVFSGSVGQMTILEIHGDGGVWVNGSGPNAMFELDGISYRCAPSGQNGCP